MTGTIDEGDVAAEAVVDVGGGVGEGVGMGGAAGCVESAFGSVVGVGFGFGRGGGGGGEGITLVDFGIGVTEFDGDVSYEFVFETDGLDAGDGFDDGGFSVGYVTDGSDVDCGLSTNNFGR